MNSAPPKYKFDADRISFIPRKYRQIVPEMLDNEGKRQEFEEAMESHRSFYFYGSPGTGKTFLGFLIAKYSTGKWPDLHGHDRINKAVEYISFPAFILQLQCSFGITNKENTSAFELLRRTSSEPRLLLIDDFGAEGLTDFVRRAIYFMINERDLSGRQTIITSNYPMAAIDAQIDRRISSRIAGMCKILEFTGNDRRLTNA